MKPMARRTLLVTAGLVGAGALGYGGSIAACSVADRRRAMLEPFFPMLRDVADPRRLGRSWLQIESGDDLIPRIFERRELAEAVLLPDRTSRYENLRAVIRNEFARGDVVLVDRWLTVRSEARIAAGWVLYG